MAANSHEYQQLNKAIVEGEVQVARQLTKELLDSDHDAREIFRDGVIGGMNQIDLLYREHKLMVPEILMSVKAMKAAMEVLSGELPKNEQNAPKKKVVLGTVEGDVHDIGKNLVALVLQNYGYEVIDLGVNVSKEKFLEAMRENDAQVVCISAMLTTVIKNVASTIEFLKSQCDDGDHYIIVGGAAMVSQFAKMHDVDYSSTPFDLLEIIDSYE